MGGHLGALRRPPGRWPSLTTAPGCRCAPARPAPWRSPATPPASVSTSTPSRARPWSTTRTGTPWRAVLAVSHPAFVLLDHDDQALRVSRWGHLQAALAQSTSLSALQVLEAVVPDRGDGVSHWYEGHGARPGSWADRQYRALLEQARLGSSTHRTTVSLALDLRAASKSGESSRGRHGRRRRRPAPGPRDALGLAPRSGPRGRLPARRGRAGRNRAGQPTTRPALVCPHPGAASATPAPWR